MSIEEHGNTEEVSESSWQWSGTRDEFAERLVFRAYASEFARRFSTIAPPAWDELQEISKDLRNEALAWSEAKADPNASQQRAERALASIMSWLDRYALDTEWLRRCVTTAVYANAYAPIQGYEPWASLDLDHRLYVDPITNAVGKEKLSEEHLITVEIAVPELRWRWDPIAVTRQEFARSARAEFSRLLDEQLNTVDAATLTAGAKLTSKELSRVEWVIVRHTGDPQPNPYSRESGRSFSAIGKRFGESRQLVTKWIGRIEKILDLPPVPDAD